MKLIRASIHELTTRDGLKVEYARLTYRTRTGIVGQSRLLADISQVLVALARQGLRIE